MLGSRATVRISSSALRVGLVGEGQGGGLAASSTRSAPADRTSGSSVVSRGGEVDALDAVPGHRAGRRRRTGPTSSPAPGSAGPPRAAPGCAAPADACCRTRRRATRRWACTAARRRRRTPRARSAGSCRRTGHPASPAAGRPAARGPSATSAGQVGLAGQEHVRRRAGVEAAVHLVLGAHGVRAGLHLDGGLRVLGGVGPRQPAVGRDDHRVAVHREAQRDRVGAGRARRRARGRRAGGRARGLPPRCSAAAAQTQQQHRRQRYRAIRVRRARRGRADTAAPSLHRDVGRTGSAGPTLDTVSGHATAGVGESKWPTLRWAGNPLTVRNTVNLPRAFARPTVALAAFAALATVGLTGCNDATRTATQPAGEHATSTAPTADTTTADADESPAPATPRRARPRPPRRRARRPAAPPPGPAACAARLLDAADVPGFNDDYRWTEGRTRSREPQAPFGTCQRFAMTSIGATAVAVRDYLPAAGGTQAPTRPPSWSRSSPTRPPHGARSRCSRRGEPSAPTSSGASRPSEVGDLQDVSVRRRHRWLVPPHLRPGRR